MYMWKKSDSLMNRVMCGIMACLLTLAAVLSPKMSMSVYAKQNLLDLSYKEVEKKDAEIYVQAENCSFEAGEEVELKIWIQNNTDMTLINGALSWKDRKEALENKRFVYNGENPEIEVNEKGSLTNVTLAPGEICEVSFFAEVSDSLTWTNKRTIGFFFGSENAGNKAEKITGNTEFAFTSGLVTLLPVEFENDLHEVAAGTAGSMKVYLAIQDPESRIMISEDGSGTSSNAKRAVETKSNAEKDTETASNAIAETASDSEKNEKFQKLDKVLYHIETYGIRLEDVWIAEAVTTKNLDGIAAEFEYDVAAESPAGTYFGKIEAEIKFNGKTYHAEQGFDITVTEALTEEQLLEVSRVIALIDKLPEPEVVWAKAEELYNAGDLEGYEAYVRYIAELAWPAYYAYQALNDAQKALVTNYYKLELTAGLWSAVPLGLQDAIVYQGEALRDILNVLDADETVEKAKAELKADGTIRLTSLALDPWVWIDLSNAADRNHIGKENYYAVVAYVRADETTETRKMRLCPVLGNGKLSDETDYLWDTTTDEYYDYAAFDFSTKVTDENISKFRFDFADHDTPPGYSIDIDYIGFFHNKEEAEAYVKKNRPDARRDSDISTVENSSAIKFQLFDYSRYINKNKKDDTEDEFRPISNYFTFRGIEGKTKTQIPDHVRNEDYDADTFTVNHAAVAWNLDAKGYPVLDLSRQADGTIRDLETSDPMAYRFQKSGDRSLAYLFGGKKDHAVTVYHPDNTILVEENGHYFYNSKDHAVDFNIKDNRFYVRDYIERNSDTSKFEGYYDFLPFNYTKGRVVGNGSTGQEHQIDTYDVNYWFGMRMDVDFYQGKDGKLDGEDMIFKFSGDDDVWVFLDGKLSMDLGGTHGAVSGEINFATGEVKQYLDWKGSNYENLTEGNQKYTTTLYKEFENAYKEQGMDDTAVEKALSGIFETYTKEENTYHRLKSYTPHKLSFFYMERGSSVANCMIDFNLPVVPDESLTVTKVLEEDGDMIPDDTLYKFKVLKKGSDELLLGAGTPYEILENNKKIEDGKVDDNGIFAIKAGQSARFLNMLEKTSGETEYQVAEVLENNMSDNHVTNWDYKMHYREVRIDDGNDTTTITPVPSDDGCYKTEVLSAESSHVVTYTNVVKPGNLKIRKEVIGSSGKDGGGTKFAFELFCEELKEKTFLVESGSNAEKLTFDRDGKARVEIFSETSVLLKDLPAGVEISIREIGFDGYVPGWQDENGNIKVGAETKADIKIGGTTEVTCVNRMGAVLPITGDTGTGPYRMGGTLIMLLAAEALLFHDIKRLRAISSIIKK